MKVIYLNNIDFTERFANPTVLALGFFDGVHLGHQQLIMKAKEISNRINLKLAVMTFYPHPKEVLQGGRFNYLMTLEAKEEKMRQMGVDYLYVIDFNKEFAKLSPNTFVKNYITDLNVKHVVAGFDYTYGHKGMGTMALMGENGGGEFEVTVLSKVELNGIKISSTHIRNLISMGDVKQVKSFMGSDYEAKGQIYIPYFGKLIQISNPQKFVPDRNAYTFVPANHCLIPCVGKYTVEVQSNNYSKFATAEVFEGMSNEKVVIIQFCNRLELDYTDIEFRIKWIDRLESEGIKNERQLKELVHYG